MDFPGGFGTFPASMKPLSPLAVAFREVRHFAPDDCLHVESLAVRGEEYAWTIPAHRHEGLHQFMWLERGAASLRLDQVPHTLRGPAALMLAPGCVHAFDFAPGSRGLQVTAPSERLQRSLGASPALAARLRPSLLLQGEPFAAEAPAGGALFEALRGEFERSAPGRADALQAHLLLLATWFLRQAPGAAAEGARQALRDTLVQRYRSLLELHLRRQRRLDFYAGQLGVTPDHLSRACRAVTGLSALDLQHERLLLEARRLLAYTQATVAEAAHELGFDDPAYFSRFFARRAGLAPQAYRAALASGAAQAP